MSRFLVRKLFQISYIYMVIALVLIFSATPAFSADVPDPKGIWEKTFGGSDRDEGFSFQQTTYGGFVIAGWTRSYGTGRFDVYLIKTDSIEHN